VNLESFLERRRGMMVTALATNPVIPMAIRRTPSVHLRLISSTLSSNKLDSFLLPIKIVSIVKLFDTFAGEEMLTKTYIKLDNFFAIYNRDGTEGTIVTHERMYRRE